LMDSWGGCGLPAAEGDATCCCWCSRGLPLWLRIWTREVLGALPATDRCVCCWPLLWCWEGVLVASRLALAVRCDDGSGKSWMTFEQTQKAEKCTKPCMCACSQGGVLCCCCACTRFALTRTVRLSGLTHLLACGLQASCQGGQLLQGQPTDSCCCCCCCARGCCECGLDGC
jgi:hypothetical protein